MEHTVNDNKNKLQSLQNLLALSAATLIITVWATVSFLKHQNKLLEKNIKKYSNPTNILIEQPSTNPYVNWKTYINTKNEFQVKYPYNWVKNEEENSINYFVFFSPTVVQTTDSTGQVLITVDQNDDYFVKTDTEARDKFQAFLNSCSSETPTSCTQKNSDNYIFEKEILIDGIIAFQTYGGCCMDIGRHVFVYHNNYSYRLTLYNLNGNKSGLKNEDIFDQILSTFKFMDQISVTPTFEPPPSPIPTIYKTSTPPSDWKTYSNTDYKFSLKYPVSYSYNQSSGKELIFDKLINLAKFDYYDKESSFEIDLDTHSFSREYLKKYAPTALEEILPNPTTIGSKTFYYYGAGGGGVNYPDQYFYNFNGQVLKFYFWGPYENDKTPPESAKKVEVQILSSFEVTK